MAQTQYDHCVIGAGIIGLSIAFRLAEAGKRVLIIDRKGMAEETSRGNAGALAFADIEPLASPGVILKAPKWLFDPLGPLSLPPSYAPKILPWMLRFFRASMLDKVAASTKAQAALMNISKTEVEPLYDAAGIGHMLRKDGALYLYEGEKAYNSSRHVWNIRERHGVPFEPVTGQRLAKLQPGLGQTFTHGVFVPQWMTVSDPYEVATGIGRAALERGAVLEIGDVTTVVHGNNCTEVTLRDGRSFTSDSLVIACGAWSHTLAAQLGDKIPLETERGYNTTFPKTAFDLKRQLVIPGDGFVVTPLENGLRIGGAVELAGLERKPDFRRSEIMVEKAKRIMPGLRTSGGKQWMGFRPSLPDTIPVIGRSPNVSRVIYAFGHGHLGLTQAAGTARLVTDMALLRQPKIDMRPYRPERF